MKEMGKSPSWKLRRCLQRARGIVVFFSDGYHGGWIHKRNTPNNTGWFEVCVCEVWIVLMLCSTGCAGSSPKCQGHDVAALYLVAKLYWLNHRLAWLCCCEVPWDQMALESSLG
jgi:hypothetical protein